MMSRETVVLTWQIAMYKNCKINFSLQFDCDEIDDCSDLLDATDFEGTYDES